MNRLAVLGQPIAHSLSPAMHTAAFAALGIAAEWTYEAIELAPEDFRAGVRRLAADGFVGANVTIPHKLAAVELAEHRSPAAGEIGAANTLSFRSDGIHADNTDASGLIAALPRAPEGMRALVLGAGGAARAAGWALNRAGAHVSVHNRTAARAAQLADELGVAAVEAAGPIPIEGYDLLVNATSIGLERPGDGAGGGAQALKALPFRVDGLSDRMVVVDLVYGAKPTELVVAAERNGSTVVDGLEILVRQGAESLRIWTGLDPPLEPMRQAIRSQPR